MHATRKISPRPPMLLIHGFASTSRFWAPILDRLARDADVLATDLPGHGSGPSLDRTPTVEAFADSVEELLDDRGWDECHVVGHSLGGLLALDLAVRGRATTVTALAPTGRVKPLIERRTRMILRSQRTLGRLLGPAIPVLARSAVARTLTMSLSASRPWRMTPDWAAETAREYCATPCFDEVIAAFDPDAMLARLHEIDVPIVVGWGARDRLVPASGAQRFRELLPPHARFVLVRGAGHALTTDAPDETVAMLRAAVRGDVTADGAASRAAR